jgi:hypothetical protein
MAPSATHPCPICIVSHKNFLSSSRHRTPADKHSIDRSHQPLLSIIPERIVPIPLHLFLGISNRIILDAFCELLGKDRVEAALKSITTVHSAGCGGKSDLYDLNGPEISKWIKKECSATLISAATASSPIPAATSASHSILSRWLAQLHHCLLRSDEWTVEDIDAWRSVVSDIHQHTGERRHLSMRFPSYICCITPSISLSGIGSLVERAKPRLRHFIPPSTISSTSSIATRLATRQRGYAAALLIRPFAPCNLFSSDFFYSLLILLQHNHALAWPDNVIARFTTHDNP